MTACCQHCAAYYERARFHSNQLYCSPNCRKRAWQLKHPAKMRAAHKRFRERHRDKRRQYNWRYYRAHTERLKWQEKLRRCKRAG